MVQRFQVRKEAASVLLDVFLGDASSTTGDGLINLAYNSAGLTCYYHRDTAAAGAAVTLVTMTVGTFTSSGFKKIDDTNLPGWYQLCLPDAAFAAGAERVSVLLKGATDLVPTRLLIELLPVGEETFAVVTDGGNTATTFKTDRASSTNDDAKDALVRFLSGALAGQIKKVSAYNGTSKFLTAASAFTATPSSGDKGVIINL